MSLLAADFFKVGTVLLPAGADQRSLPKWSTILTVAELTILTFTSRACKDFDQKVKADASAKLKRDAQMDDKDGAELMRKSCVWVWTQPHLQQRFDKTSVDKITMLWDKGIAEVKLHSTFLLSHYIDM